MLDKRQLLLILSPCVLFSLTLRFRRTHIWTRSNKSKIYTWKDLIENVLHVRCTVKPPKKGIRILWNICLILREDVFILIYNSWDSTFGRRYHVMRLSRRRASFASHTSQMLHMMETHRLSVFQTCLLTTAYCKPKQHATSCALRCNHNTASSADNLCAHNWPPLPNTHTHTHHAPHDDWDMVLRLMKNSTCNPTVTATRSQISYSHTHSICILFCSI